MTFAILRNYDFYGPFASTLFAGPNPFVASSVHSKPYTGLHCQVFKVGAVKTFVCAITMAFTGDMSQQAAKWNQTAHKMTFAPPRSSARKLQDQNRRLQDVIPRLQDDNSVCGKPAGAGLKDSKWSFPGGLDPIAIRDRKACGLRGSYGRKIQSGKCSRRQMVFCLIHRRLRIFVPLST
ncbi:hypothetical protein V8E54_009718 [Elaphomyces granulatus]